MKKELLDVAQKAAVQVFGESAAVRIYIHPHYPMLFFVYVEFVDGGENLYIDNRFWTSDVDNINESTFLDWFNSVDVRPKCDDCLSLE